MKGWYQRRKFIGTRQSILAIQRYGRGFIARQKFTEAMRNYKATVIQRYCRGYLARKRYGEKIRRIVIMQSCIRRFLAKRQFKRLKTEARSMSHLQTKYKGLENKIIELQQKFDVTNKENTVLKTQTATIPELRYVGFVICFFLSCWFWAHFFPFVFSHIFNNFREKLQALKNIENELKFVKTSMSEKEDQLISVQKSLDHERDEKMSIIEEKNKEDEEYLIERNHWQLEKQELKQQMTEVIEASKNDKNAKLSEIETNEINQAYHKVLKDKESLENENSLLKNEIRRLQMIINNPNDIDHMKHSMFSNDEDFGYSSSRNTLEKPHHKNQASIASSQLSEGDFPSLQHSNIQNNHSTTSTFERKLKNLFGFSNRGGKSFVIFFVS